MLMELRDAHACSMHRAHQSQPVQKCAPVSDSLELACNTQSSAVAPATGSTMSQKESIKSLAALEIASWQVCHTVQCRTLCSAHNPKHAHRWHVQQRQSAATPAYKSTCSIRKGLEQVAGFTLPLASATGAAANSAARAHSSRTRNLADTIFAESSKNLEAEEN